MPITIPYSVRIPKDLLDEMRRYYDRINPPKPTFSAILSYIVKMGWDSYMTHDREESKAPDLSLARSLRGSRSGPSR